MNFKRFSNSLITRLALFGVFIVITTGIARYFLLTDILHDNLTRVAAEQQVTIADYLAHDIDHRVLDRRRYLKQLAAVVPKTAIKNPIKLRAWLEEHHHLQPLFSEGLFIADLQGRIISDYPVLEGREGYSIKANPVFERVKKGEAIISEGIVSPISGKTILPMLAPIKNSQNEVIAVIGGVTALSAPDFLEHLQHADLGNTGNFILIAPKDRRIIGSNQTNLIFQQLPPVGTDPLLDRAIAGFRGSGISTNNGIEEIRAFTSVPSTDWLVITRLPVHSALPSAQYVNGFVLNMAIIQAVVLGLLIIAVTIWFMRPLLRAANQAEKMTHGQLPLAPLEVTRCDEVGYLTMAFNRLLARLDSQQNELQRLAHHDILTGLPNRIMLSERMQEALSRAQRDKTGIALLYLDLDGFKPINDTYGHQVGDQVLVEVAQRLRSVIRLTDTLARVGGDEFVILATDLRDTMEHGASILAEKCIDVTSAPLQLLPGHGVSKLTVSVGIAIYYGSQYCNYDLLMQAADQAMYKAKNKGGCYSIAPASDTCCMADKRQYNCSDITNADRTQCAACFSEAESANAGKSENSDTSDKSGKSDNSGA